MDKRMIAPCGMNCALCMARQRDKKKCGGCNGVDETKPGHCRTCGIKSCEKLLLSVSGFCGECERKCRRLRQLDRRYRANYGMSMLENLERLRTVGMERFLAEQEAAWKCKECGALLCVHRESCPSCGALWK